MHKPLKMEAKPVSTKNFYGKKRKLNATLEVDERRQKKRRIPTSYKQRLLGPLKKWQIYKKQSDAFECQRTQRKDLRVFAYESETFGDNLGKRQYLVTSVEEYWFMYNQLTDKQKHHYEVIQEGCVCKLYFDLEFMREFNKDKQNDGEKMTTILIKYVAYHMKRVFDVDVDLSMALVLDASTPAKFSQHVIVKHPKVAFQDNLHAGDFVKSIIGILWDIRENDLVNSPDVNKIVEDLKRTNISPDDLAMLFVRKKDGETEPFVDLAVYTKNRNFRVYLSSKLGKANPLVEARNNKHVAKVPRGINNTLEYQLFLNSLVSHVRYHKNMRILRYDETNHHFKLPTKRRPGLSKTLADAPRSEHGPTKYPGLDTYIKTLISQGGSPGHIRQWSHFKADQRLHYDIENNRYCERIRRQHKSNHIMWVAEYGRGVCYQKCHDPDCKAVNFKSREYEIPKSAFPETFSGHDGNDGVTDEDLVSAVDAADIEEDDSISDSLLVAALEKAESNFK